MPRSLSARVTAGAVLVVAVVLAGSGLAVVRLTEQRDRRDADGALRRVAGNLLPQIMGALGVAPPPRPAGRPPVPLQIFDAAGKPIFVPEAPPPLGRGTAGPPPGPGSRAGRPPGVQQVLRDAFVQGGDSSSPIGRIGFVRARDLATGRHLVLGLVPTGFPAMPAASGARSVSVAGGVWRDVAVTTPVGALVEIAAPERVSARSASLREIVIWTGVAGLIVALFGALLATRVALRPLTALRRRAAGIRDASDLATRVREPGQPTEVAALADELDGMLERLEAATAAREGALLAARRFAADAGHELRTPLQSIRSNLDIASSPSATPDERLHAMEVATVQSERMNRLVDGLQGLARGESGLVASAVQVDLGDIADGAVFATRTRHPEVSIEAHLPESGPVVTGDGDGLWRVVENLLENAARHGRAGGRVRITVAELPQAGGPGRGAEIVVEDDGPGIPPAERERVMRRFERGPGAAAAGSGLGLAIVEAEARRHGGTLSLGGSRLGGLLARVTVDGPAAP
jgi:signal transduction histidine kinase